MDELNPQDQQGIREVIRQQLRALSRQDGDGALARLTRSRRRGTGRHFLECITRVYPQLAQAWKTEFGDPAGITDKGLIAQPVKVTAWDRTTLKAVYLLARQQDGSFLIDGCVCSGTPDSVAVN